MECAMAIVGMAVVPADELGGGAAVRQILAGNAETSIGAGSARQNDDVIGAAQLLDRQRPADLDISEEGEAGRPRDLVVGQADLLDLGMIGRHSAADQTERRG